MPAGSSSNKVFFWNETFVYLYYLETLRVLNQHGFGPGFTAAGPWEALAAQVLAAAKVILQPGSIVERREIKGTEIVGLMIETLPYTLPYGYAVGIDYRRRLESPENITLAYLLRAAAYTFRTSRMLKLEKEALALLESTWLKFVSSISEYEDIHFQNIDKYLLASTTARIRRGITPRVFRVLNPILEALERGEPPPFGAPGGNEDALSKASELYVLALTLEVLNGDPSHYPNPIPLSISSTRDLKAHYQQPLDKNNCHMPDIILANKEPEHRNCLIEIKATTSKNLVKQRIREGFYQASYYLNLLGGQKHNEHRGLVVIVTYTERPDSDEITGSPRCWQTDQLRTLVLSGQPTDRTKIKYFLSWCLRSTI